MFLALSPRPLCFHEYFAGSQFLRDQEDDRDTLVATKPIIQTYHIFNGHCYRAETKSRLTGSIGFQGAEIRSNQIPKMLFPVIFFLTT